jgi:ATP-dependent Zn protease
MSDEHRTLPDDPRVVAAIHEAGHAIVSLALRTGVRTVDIHNRAEGHEGLTKYRRRGKPYQGSRDVHERRGATALGGMAAVWLASGKQNDHRFSPGDMFPGLTYVYELVGTNAPVDEANACWDALYARAVAILDERWSAVEAVTHVLVEESSINRQRLLEIVGSARGQT